MTDPTQVTSGAARLFFPEEGSELPFTVENRSGCVVVLNLDPAANNHPALATTASHKWIHGLRGKLIVDFSRVPMINSSLCNWLVNLMRSAKPSPVSIIGANARVAETLRLLRLDTLLSIDS